MRSVLTSYDSEPVVQGSEDSAPGAHAQTSTFLQPAHCHTLPLCSFGPGGSYVVDWQVLGDDLADSRRVFPPRTLVSALQRFATWVAADVKGWLLAGHPGRKYRADTHPAALEPCVTCGHADLWPQWFVQGLSAPLWEQTPTRTTESSAAAVSAAAETPEVPVAAPVSADPSADDAESDSWPYLFRNSLDLEPVRDFSNTSAGHLLARLAPRPERAVEHKASLAPNTEYSHDPNPQTAQDSDRHPRLPGAQRLLADHAGTGRSARRLQGDHLRAHRGHRTQGSHSPRPQQGSLFGDCADGQAA